MSSAICSKRKSNVYCTAMCNPFHLLITLKECSKLRYTYTCMPQFQIKLATVFWAKHFTLHLECFYLSNKNLKIKITSGRVHRNINRSWKAVSIHLHQKLGSTWYFLVNLKSQLLLYALRQTNWRRLLDIPKSFLYVLLCKLYSVSLNIQKIIVKVNNNFIYDTEKQVATDVLINTIPSTSCRVHPFHLQPLKCENFKYLLKNASAVKNS